MRNVFAFTRAQRYGAQWCLNLTGRGDSPLWTLEEARRRASISTRLGLSAQLFIVEAVS